MVIVWFGNTNVKGVLATDNIYVSVREEFDILDTWSLWYLSLITIAVCGKLYLFVVKCDHSDFHIVPSIKDLQVEEAFSPETIGTRANGLG